MLRLQRCAARSFSATARAAEQPMYLNPHAWKGLPADRIFELHEMRKTALGDKYVPNDDERNAILSTVTQLGKRANPELEYVYALDHFKERHMNNTPANLRGRPPQLTGIPVIKQGETPHLERKRQVLNTVSAFEMPLLAKFRQPYQPAEAHAAPLVLKYGDDFGNTDSVCNRKVSLKCAVKSLQLSEKQVRKLKVLAASRYDHARDEIRISSQHHAEAAQNARWLVETFGKLVAAAKDPADSLEDVPIDTRHTRAQLKILNHRPRAQFPSHWKRPQDAPVEKFKVVRKLVERVKAKKDEEYTTAYTP
ncbi:Small ribosomal subunit protein mS35 [[Candida] zeylanoides]